MTVIRRPARSLPLRPPSPEPTRKNPAVVAAAVIAAGTVVTGVFSFVGPTAAADRAPSERTCAVVGRADAPTGPRRDGKSTLDDDGTATGCVARRT